MKRNIYLSSLPLGEAKELFFRDIQFMGQKTELVSTDESLGRISSEPIFAKLSSPHYNASAMDGVMVCSKDTLHVNELNPKLLLKNQFKYVDTGDVITEPYDAVIMIEDIQERDGGIEISDGVTPWQHIRPIGEDIVQSEMILKAGHQIRPVDIGALYSGGIFELNVVKKPSVGILPTGTEIVEPKLDVVPGEIIDSNSRMFEALTLELGGQPVRYNPLADNYNLLKEHIYEMSTCHDIILVNAGSSAGSEDYTKQIIEELGQVLVHGVAIKPGKPAILGIINNKPIVGIPGYPVSAYFVYDIYVRPLLDMWYKRQTETRSHAKVRLSKRLMSSLKHREFVRMKLGYVNEKIVATPLNRGAGVTMSLVNADAICVVPQSVEGYEAGQEVDVELLKPLESIKQTLVSIGSHDILLDLVRDMIKNADFTSTHVGSMGGIMAMKKGEAHIAPIHLLNEKNGVYNKDFMNKYLSDKDVILIRGVKRTQGLYIEKGNPLKIKGIEDLTRSDIYFINRQKGAGTRILFDYLLKENGIKGQDIQGYKREMMTHMTVASAIKSGTAQMGMGIESVSKVLDIDFIPIGDEHYDFIVSKNVLDTPMYSAFIEVLKSQEFKEKLMSIGGYSCDGIGERINYERSV